MIMMMMVKNKKKKKGKKAEQEERERERARAEPKLSVLTWVYEHTLMSWLWGRSASYCSQAPRLPPRCPHP